MGLPGIQSRPTEANRHPHLHKSNGDIVRAGPTKDPIATIRSETHQKIRVRERLEFRLWANYPPLAKVFPSD